MNIRKGDIVAGRICSDVQGVVKEVQFRRCYSDHLVWFAWKGQLLGANRKALRVIRRRGRNA